MVDVVSLFLLETLLGVISGAVIVLVVLVTAELAMAKVAEPPLPACTLVATITEVDFGFMGIGLRYTLHVQSFS